MSTPPADTQSLARELLAAIEATNAAREERDRWKVFTPVWDDAQHVHSLASDRLSVLRSNAALSTLCHALIDADKDREDAAKWRALMGCERIGVLGGATRGYPAGRGLLGVEFYGSHPPIDDDESRVRFTSFVDGLAFTAARSPGIPQGDSQ